MTLGIHGRRRDRIEGDSAWKPHTVSDRNDILDNGSPGNPVYPNFIIQAGQRLRYDDGRNIVETETRSGASELMPIIVEGQKIINLVEPSLNYRR